MESKIATSVFPLKIPLDEQKESLAVELREDTKKVYRAIAYFLKNSVVEFIFFFLHLELKATHLTVLHHFDFVSFRCRTLST
jgi:hypothetical protein